MNILTALGTKAISAEIISEKFVINATHCFFTSSSNFLFVIKEGNLDLCFLSLKEKKDSLLAIQETSDQCFIFSPDFLPKSLHVIRSFQAEDCLFPFPLNSSTLSVCAIAVARVRCEIIRISLDSLFKILPRSPTLLASISKHMQEWLENLSPMENKTLSSSSLTLAPYDLVSLEMHTVFKANELHKFSFLKIYQGEVCYQGLPDLKINDCLLLYPFYTKTCFKCLQPTILELIPFQMERLLEKQAWTGFFYHQFHLLSFLTHIQENEQIEDKQATQQEHSLKDQFLFNQSFRALEDVLEAERPLMFIEHPDLLFQVCQLIGEQSGLIFSYSKSPTAYTVEQSLQALCSNSNIYYRRVHLTNTWWQKQTVPLLGFFGEKGSPVALLPHPSVGYQIVDPVQGIRLTITTELANQISATSYMFYRQLSFPSLKFRHIWTFTIWQHKAEWLTFAFLMFCSALVTLSLPFMTGLLFDLVIPNRNYSLLLQIAIAAFIIACVSVVFHFGQKSILLRLINMHDHDLEMAIWQRLMKFSSRFFRLHTLYDLFTYISAIPSIRQFLTNHFIEAFFNLFFSFLYLFLMFYYSYSLALIGTLLLVLQLLVILPFFYFGVSYERQSLNLQIQTNNKILETVQALSKVRLAGAEARLFNRWQQSFVKTQKMNFKLLLLNMKASLLNLSLSNISTWILYLFTILLFYPNMVNHTVSYATADLSVGSFIAFFTAFSLFSTSIQRFGTTLLSSIRIIPFWEKIKSFSSATDLEDFSNKFKPGVLQGEIRIDHLSFSYQPDIPPVLQDVSLTIFPGESVAFVGPSGCGKTTLIRLLLGFEYPTGGSIFYDKKNLKELNLQALRQQLGVVLQTGAIFDGTILDNINSGRQYSVNEVNEAIYLSGAHTFIQDLSMGIHTALTNGGGSLSGGQKQLILLARAIVGNPKILILDEATSSLDNEKQKTIDERLRCLCMTRIIIAQRLNTIQHVDRIYVMDKGRIVDQGKFVELANRPGLFADLLANQLPYKR